MKEVMNMYKWIITGENVSYPAKFTIYDDTWAGAMAKAKKVNDNNDVVCVDVVGTPCDDIITKNIFTLKGVVQKTSQTGKDQDFAIQVYADTITEARKLVKAIYRNRVFASETYEYIERR